MSKVKRREYYKKYRKENPEKIRTIVRKYYQKNKDTPKYKQMMKDNHRRYVEKNSEKIKKKNKENYDANRPEILRKAKIRYDNNIKGYKDYKMKYYKDNKETIKNNRFESFDKLCKSKITSNKVADRKYKRNIIEEEFITGEWIKQELDKQHNKCHYCKRKLILEKYHNKEDKQSQFSIDRKDNSMAHHKTNCVICCANCNYRKHNKPYKTWLRKFNHKTIYDYLEPEEG